MKKTIKSLVVVVGLLAATMSAKAQGTFNFLTFNADPNLGSVSIDTGGLAGPSYSGQIFGGAVGADPATFVALGSASLFVNSAGNPAGVINGGKQTATGFAGATAVDVVLRAWDNASGDYATARVSGTSGQSGVFTITLGGGVPPLADPNVNTFANFTLTTVPEPSVIMLGLAGAGLLWFRRKK
jgi:hypothetical protein